MFRKLIILITGFVIANNVYSAAAGVSAEDYIMQVTQEELDNSDKKCLICHGAFQSLSVNDDIYKANCQTNSQTVPHIFHKDCILRWINSGQEQAYKCPMCRGVMRAILSLSPESWFALIAREDFDGVKDFIDSGIDLNIKNTKLKKTALMIASEMGYTNIVTLLIASGADLNIKSLCEITALMLASCNGHIDIARLLIQFGADLNIKDGFGVTALMNATAIDRIDIVTLLIDSGADLNMKSVFGNTALIYASHKGYAHIVELLINRGADLSIKDMSGCTALMHAIDGDHREVVNLLTHLTQKLQMC